jgi:hypothetical protein
MAEKPPTAASTLIAQYETLRMAMLGEALPPEARSGLMLFLRRGMWGWARSLAVGGGVGRSRFRRGARVRLSPASAAASYTCSRQWQ